MGPTWGTGQSCLRAALLDTVLVWKDQRRGTWLLPLFSDVATKADVALLGKFECV